MRVSLARITVPRRLGITRTSVTMYLYFRSIVLGNNMGCGAWRLISIIGFRGTNIRSSPPGTTSFEGEQRVRWTFPKSGLYLFC